MDPSYLSGGRGLPFQCIADTTQQGSGQHKMLPMYRCVRVSIFVFFFFLTISVSCCLVVLGRQWTASCKICAESTGGSSRHLSSSFQHQLMWRSAFCVVDLDFHGFSWKPLQKKLDEIDVFCSCPAGGHPDSTVAVRIQRGPVLVLWRIDWWACESLYEGITLFLELTICWHMSIDCQYTPDILDMLAQRKVMQALTRPYPVQRMPMHNSHWTRLSRCGREWLKTSDMRC